MTSHTPYDVIIGLEVHVQLATRTKLFCRCPTTFGAPPNTQTCPVCIGLPGALPVMNRDAYQLAVQAALALNCHIPHFTKWDRKNYYYPDLPKGYQISQYDQPLSHDGYLEIRDPEGNFGPRRIGIIRAHLEEDAGKSLHDEISGRHDSRIDLNRTGTPLLEIVSQPDLRSAREARVFLSELKLLLTYLRVSDCNMQEGSLRVDANINLHVAAASGTVATPIVEVKNMNSFRAVERALEFEALRQYAAWQTTGQKLGDVPKQTRGWDEQAQQTKAQRSKEESSDYRYFPDPDLAPVTVTAERIEEIRGGLGMLPSQRREQLQSQFHLSPYDADVIVNQGPAVVEYFLQVATASSDSRRASNWIQQNVFATLNDRGITMEGFPIPASRLADLIRAVGDGTLDSNRAKDVYQHLLDADVSVAEAMQRLGIEQVDNSSLRQLCRELVAAHPRIAADVRSGKEKAVGALVGMAKKRNPNAHPAEVRELCLQLIRGE